jgi:hypothetical protein
MDPKRFCLRVILAALMAVESAFACHIGEGRLSLCTPRFGRGASTEVKTLSVWLCCSATTPNYVETNLLFGSALFLLPVEGCGLADAYYSGSGLGRAFEMRVMTDLTRNQKFSFSKVNEAIDA